ncbi:MAG: gliding motility-associated ABC transporter permease subunit GldF [Lewinellaceae bacterium]|nr:gliding motility-associated ABC transporter permease subunit GldF [Lewinellaceae bacterium]
MLSIFLKEVNSFFSSLIGYIVIGVFLMTLGLVMFVFPDTSLLNFNYATLDQLFEIGPMIFVFLIPAITMRSFAEEQQAGTIELLATRPVTSLHIIMGKYLASLLLLAFALLPTGLYYYTVYQLGSPPGNLDSGAILGSYIGLFFLAGAFAAIGLFASSLSGNQIVAFLLAAFLCFFLYWGFDFLSRLPVFAGKMDDVVQMFGIDYHYNSISRGLVDTRDIVYFISVIALFIMMTMVSLERRKW